MLGFSNLMGVGTSMIPYIKGFLLTEEGEGIIVIG